MASLECSQDTGASTLTLRNNVIESLMDHTGQDLNFKAHGNEAPVGNHLPKLKCQGCCISSNLEQLHSSLH